ncbi:hypothetical protein [Streptomyces sp. NPDC059708]|uniref:DUF6197 family protein n=1 Tax=Streptomyces sp. NPDC059708 TaxID=3346916 RepID=UPI003673D402
MPTIAEEIDARHHFWYGLSGLRVKGAAVAVHLEAAADLMRRENWDPQLYDYSAGRQLVHALRHTAEDGHGDDDTRYIGRQCMELLLRRSLGAPYVDCWVWAEHRSRTLAEITDLLMAAALFARTHGPI